MQFSSSDSLLLNAELPQAWNPSGSSSPYLPQTPDTSTQQLAPLSALEGLNSRLSGAGSGRPETPTSQSTDAATRVDVEPVGRRWTSRSKASPERTM